jgi:hypothetical protein
MEAEKEEQYYDFYQYKFCMIIGECRLYAFTFLEENPEYVFWYNIEIDNEFARASPFKTTTNDSGNFNSMR